MSGYRQPLLLLLYCCCWCFHETYMKRYYIRHKTKHETRLWNWKERNWSQRQCLFVMHSHMTQNFLSLSFILSIFLPLFLLLSPFPDSRLQFRRHKTNETKISAFGLCVTQDFFMLLKLFRFSSLRPLNISWMANYMWIGFVCAECSGLKINWK